MTEMKLPSENLAVLNGIKGEMTKAVVIDPQDLSAIVGAAVLGGAVLFEGEPGTGKSATAVALAASIGGEHGRTQGTPDILPSDIVGTRIFNQKDGMFTFHKGPIFSNVYHIDEINRIQPKSQSALLQGMQERIVTIPGDQTYELPQMSVVTATQNASEIGQGTYPLTKAGNDRFMVGIEAIQSEDEELAVLELLENPYTPNARTDPEGFLAVRACVLSVAIDAASKKKIVTLNSAVRGDKNIDPEETQMSGSRKNLHMAAQAKSFAFQAGREVVNDEDILAATQYVLPHRIGLTNEAIENGLIAKEIVKEVAEKHLG